ncbi:MAG: RloB domain-containing protein [Lachnospiraceae bacterium]|jgi:hypothetical protein|nr:RloB domain-containing protein [Lachnospiraceae bacterium]
MGTDELFKKRRAARKKRQHDIRTPQANSYLIITEGTRTEPFYFKGLQKLIQETIGGTIQVVEVPAIDIYGEGCATGKLIEEARQLVKKAKIFYQNVWIVFDKDDFEDFDQAIQEGEANGYKIAWSNQSFEYWLYLHFHYSDSALHRKEWAGKLTEVFKEYQLGNGVYQKNDSNIYQVVDTYGGVEVAIRNAKRRMSTFEKDRDKPSQYDPGTTVYQLVEELKQYLQ